LFQKYQRRTGSWPDTLFLSVSGGKDAWPVGFHQAKYETPLQQAGLRRRLALGFKALLDPETRALFQTTVSPVISGASRSELGKSLVFHEIIIFRMPSYMFTSKPKNRERCFSFS
jgi:hypothetical protein